jgi:hypothetical protein
LIRIQALGDGKDPRFPIELDVEIVARDACSERICFDRARVLEVITNRTAEPLPAVLRIAHKRSASSLPDGPSSVRLQRLCGNEPSPTWRVVLAGRDSAAWRESFLTTTLGPAVVLLSLD